ncbi:MAG: DUF6328 family protein [Actinomycetota bacterium]|nr:DUF6328 family protein [Actinomycetota bacterium]
MTSVEPASGISSESELQRLERNWAEILQELRVLQTGTQILTGFLLAMAFQQRFTTLSGVQLVTYLTLVALSVLAAVLALTPVALHRALFRRHAKLFLVRAANVILRIALVVVGVTLSGIVLLIFDVVVSPRAGIVAGTITAVVCLAAWLAVPVIARLRDPDF